MDMIRRLHRKFIWMATASVVAIIVLAVGLINGSLYVRVHHEISSITDIISQNGGTIPSDLAPQEKGLFEFGNWAEETPEFSYQARYFSILFDANKKEAKVINVNHIAAFNAKEAFNLAVRVLQTGKSEDFFLKDRAYYNYKITQTASGDTLVVFFDCTWDILALSSIFSYSVALGLFCIVLFFLIITFLSSKAIKPFVRNMENQKRFITNASHELKTPVAIISANTEALELVSGKSEWTGNIIKQTKRLTNLINDLVALARVGEIEKENMKLEDVDISQVTETIAGDFRQVAAERGKTLETHIPPGVHVRSEEKLFGQILGILLDNAVKYCDEKGRVQVEVTTEKKEKGFAIIISNDFAEGKDIDYTKFFERFYRHDISHSSQIKGYGVGLSMAADIVKLLDGTIDVSWKEGRISFRLCF